MIFNERACLTFTSIIYFSLIVKSCLNPFLEQTSPKQWGKSFLLKETTVAFDGVRTHIWPMRHATPGFTIEGIIANFLFIFVLPFFVVIRVFHLSHNGQWPLTSKDFYTRFYSLHYFLILILEKEPVFPFSMLSAKQGNHWYQFYNVFGMTHSLTGD